MADAILAGENSEIRAGHRGIREPPTEISALRTIGNDWLRMYSESWLKPPLSALNPPRSPAMYGHRCLEFVALSPRD